MSSSSTEFDLNSLAEKGLQQKLLDVEREYKEKCPIIQMVIDDSKRLMDISITKRVPDTKAILDQIRDARENVLSTHARKMSEIDSILEDINAKMVETGAEILKIEAAIEELENIEKGDLVINETDILAFQSAVKELEEVENGSSSDTDKSQSLTIRCAIEYTQRLEYEARKNLESLKEHKKKNLDRKSSWNTFTPKLIQKLDEMKEEHLKNSYTMITTTIKMSEENIKRGEQSLKNLERRYHAVLKYRRLCYLKQDSLPRTSALTPR